MIQVTITQQLQMPCVPHFKTQVKKIVISLVSVHSNFRN
jgi:hypothetical protein